MPENIKNFSEREIQIIPAILEPDFDSVEKYVYEYKKFSNKIQIDVCDGVYVENKTWLPNSFDDITFLDMDLEFDMMVSENNMEKCLNNLFFYDAKYIILHYKSFSNILNLENIIKKIREKNKIIKIGIGINSRQEINQEVQNIINKIDYIQIMGIEKIGIQKQSFDILVLQTIKNIKMYLGKLNLENKAENIFNKYIQIDGAMNAENILSCHACGATSFAVGSYLKESKNKKETFNNLKNLWL
jgi:pentose-5-phosphate-3-epimerase